MDKRAYNEASLITNKPFINVNDLLAGLGRQLPVSNSFKAKETSRRLIVPVSSTIADGTIDLLTNNEHLNKSLQDKYV